MATTTYGTPYVAGTDLVANWPAASLTVANSIDAAGYYIGRGINAQTVSYQTVLTDAGKTISMTAAGATTVTIPANASVAYVVGTRINILNLGAGACTPTAGAGVTISGTITALAQNGAAAVIKTATNTWSYIPFDSGTPNLTSGDVSSTTGSPSITTSGGRTIYAFSGSGTIVLAKAGLCYVLAVGGGGGGGQRNGGGGAAGGFNYQTAAYLPSGTNTVTIGAGGAAGTSTPTPGGSGAVSGIGNVVVAAGGGGGGSITQPGGNGGSGGGGGGAGATAAGNGYAAQGNNGGAGTAASTAQGGGGGGGSAGAGVAGTSSTGGNGGAATSNSITGSALSYSGGGGGGSTGGTAGTGGTNAGSGTTNNTTAASGTINTGGGGGGGGFASGAGGVGGAGGSGIVIVSVVT